MPDRPLRGGDQPQETGVHLCSHKREVSWQALWGRVWYENYPEVDSHMALVKQAEDWSCQVSERKLHCKIGSMFVRIGEEANDIEERFNGDYSHDWISTSRQIITDWS